MPPYHDPADWGEDSAGQAGAALFGLTDVEGTLFFAACQRQNVCELWTSGGDSESTRQIAEFVPSNPGNSDDWLRPEFGALGTAVFFPACDEATGCELWTSDGSETGTRLFDDLNPGWSISFDVPDGAAFARVGDTLLFHVLDHNATDLWRTDGTKAGTFPLRPGLLDHARAVGDQAFFVAPTENGPVGLWKTRGTEGDTELVRGSGIDWTPGLTPWARG